MNNKTRLRTSLAFAGVLAAGVAGAAWAPAQADPAHQPGEASIVAGSGTDPSKTASPETTSQTRLTLSRPMVARLGRTHVTLKTTGAASTGVHHGVTTLRFPVKSYNDHGTPTAHRGGITFRRGSADVHLDHLQLQPRRGVVVATIEHDARTPFFRVSTDRHGVAHVELNKLMAGQLNTTFGTHRFVDGQTFGTLRTTRLPGSGSSESITVHVKNTTKWTLDLHQLDTHGMGTVTNDPADQLEPGESTDVDVASNGNGGGTEVTIYYRVDGTLPDWTLNAYFQVPTVGKNQNACSQGGQVSYHQCSIGSGYTPEATWEPAMTATSPVLDFGDAGSVWMFRKGVTPAKGLLVDGASDDDAALVSLTTLSGDTKNERWTWDPSADHPGWGQLVNLESGKCLEHNERNGNVDQWDCGGTGNMLWKPVYNKTNNATALLLMEQDNGQPQYLGLDTDPTSAGDGSAIVLVHTLSNRTSWYPNQMN